MWGPDDNDPKADHNTNIHPTRNDCKLSTAPSSSYKIMAYLGWFDANVLIQLRVCEWQFNSLLDFCDLLLKATHISIRLKGCLLNLGGWRGDTVCCTGIMTQK